MRETKKNILISYNDMIEIKSYNVATPKMIYMIKWWPHALIYARVASLWGKEADVLFGFRSFIIWQIHYSCTLI